MSGLLSSTIFFPAIGAIVLLIVRALTKSTAQNESSEARIAYLTGIFVSVATFVISLLVLAFFSPDSAEPYQLIEDVHWFGGVMNADGVYEGGIRYKFGIDGMSLLLVLLTTFLTPFLSPRKQRIDSTDVAIGSRPRQRIYSALTVPHANAEFSP